MKRLKYGLLCAVLSAASVVQAQQAVTGRVTDAETGAPIVGAAIRVERTLTGAATDNSGEFRMAHAESDAVLRVSHLGYETQTVALDGRTSGIEIRLKSSQLNIGQVVVTGTGTHRRADDAPVPMTVLTGKELQEGVMTNLEDALLKSDPSFAITPLGSMGSSITMNGLDDTYILFLVDGQRMLGSGTGAPDLARIDMSNVKRIEILDGAASVLYGSDAIAGVVNIITDDPRSGVELSTRASVRSYGRYEHSVGLDAKEGRLGVYTSFVHQQADGWRLNPLEENKNGELIPSMHMASFAMASNTVSQRFTYDLARGLSLYVDGSYYHYDQFRPHSIDNEETSYKYDLGHRNYTYGAGLKYIASDRVSLFADFHSDNYASTYDYFVASGDLRPGDTETRVATRFYKASLKGIFKLDRHNRLSAGLEYIDDRLDDYLSTSATLPTAVGNYTLSAYLQDEVTIDRHWQALVGLRYLYHERMGSHATPNVSVMYRTGGFKARASYAAGYKTPALSEIYTFNVSKDGALTIGNEDLRPEKSHYASLNLEYGTGRMNFSLTGFYNRLIDKVEVESFEVSDEELRHYRSIYGDGVTQSVVKKRSNIDKARIAGVTIAAQAYLGAGFSVRGAYNFIDGVNLTAPDGADDRLDKSIRHAGNVSADWEHAWNKYTLHVELNGRMSGKRYSSTYSPRIGDAPCYSLWDLVATHTFRLGRVILTPAIGIENLFDYRDDRPAYLHYTDASGKAAATVSPYATLTPGRTCFFSLGIRLRNK